MHRLDRRIRILRDKRRGCFDVDQRYLDQAVRARAARRVRLALRRMQPVVLVTPRWSEAHAFLDELGVDLQIGRPAVVARTFSVASMHERPLSEAWSWVVRALIEFCGLQQEGPFGHAVDREGFRNVLRRVFARVRTGPRRALLVHGVEHLHLSVREDLVKVFLEHVEAAGEDRRLNLLLAGAIDPASLPFEGAEVVTLADYARVEAVEALVEHLGPLDRARLDELVRAVGGVPALLATLVREGANAAVFTTGRQALLQALGPLAEQIRTAITLVGTDARLGERFELVAKHGPLFEDEARDQHLIRAGLIRRVTAGRRGRVESRAAIFTELAQLG